MSTAVNVVLAIAFVVLAVSATFLMYHLWGYPFDKKKHRSSAPRWAMALHRIIGWAFVAIYIYLMIQMVPRMWAYQIELPARTVMHLVVGYSIGGLLLSKIVIVRFFKHLEATLAPPMGTAIFILTLVLMGLALPLVWREQVLSNQAINSEGFTAERLQRVSDQLPSIGLDDEKLLEELASTQGLIRGRKLMRSKCVQCHDLRTILARPRTAKGWKDTVDRMASRATIVSGFTDEEKWQITAYLIVITPTLQNAIMERRKALSQSADSAAAMQQANKMAKSGSIPYDAAHAEEIFNAKCSQCHSPALALDKTFSSSDEISQLISRMISNGLTASAEELEQIVRFLEQHHKLEAAANNATPSAGIAIVASESVQMPELASQRGCAGCHSIDSVLLGPAWREVARRYLGNPEARALLIESVKNGGSGNWNDQTGGLPMPANFPTTSEAEIAELVDFILRLE